MVKKKYFLILWLFTLPMLAQELNCNLVVNAQQTGNENVQVFKTLEKQLYEFVNNTRWTNKTYETRERIDCSMVIIIQSYSSDAFQASIQVQSARPVFNSSYSTSVYNFNDKDFNFNYLEYQNLNFNSSQFESNLISVIGFHVYMILGMDADTFELNGGQKYYEQARDIANYSQRGNSKGWEPPKGGDQTRRVLIDNIMSNTYSEFRSALYTYHRTGLDIMASDSKAAKNVISKTIVNFQSLNKRRPNSLLVRAFFDAKADEITDIFSSGPKVKITDLVSVLNKVAPIHSKKWQKIKF
jgi:hypothetical protein|tara:strand:+ start:600 stop:1493 length:894 start_codon:yes stop_codon:yes gene_type:complete